MDLPKRALPQGSPRGSPQKMRRRDTEADENARAWSQSPRRAAAEWAASPERKKVLGERNSGGDGSEAASPPPTSQAKAATSPPSLSGRGEGAYDPKTNYTTPRPEFLRYNPEKRREILLRLEREEEDESSPSSVTSGTPAVSESVSSASSARGDQTERDGADIEEEDMEDVPASRGGRARRLLLLLVAVACSCCYIWCMNSSPFPASETGLNFAGPTGSVHDANVNQVDPLGLQAPIKMMGSDHVSEEATGEIVHRDSENPIQLYGSRGGSPKNFMAIATMGLVDACPNVPFGEFTCQIGDRIVENVHNSKEDFQLSEQAPVVIVAPSENAEQSGEVEILDGNVIADSIGSTYTADMEENESGLVHHEEEEDHSNHSPWLASMENALEQENEVLGYGEGLESKRLDQATEPWEEYENTAKAAKAMVSMVKSLWSSMKPHLMEMLAFFSVAAFAVAMLKYFQRSPKDAPVSKRRPAAQPPVFAPNQTAKLPAFPSSQHVQQPVHLTVPKEEPPVRLEIPVLSPLPKPDLFASLKEPVQLPLPKAEPSVNLNIPVQFPLPKQIDCGNCLQKIQQDDADNARTLDGYTVTRREIDSSRPPVVSLLGEFSFVDSSSSKRSSQKDSNDHTGDVPVQEPSVTLRKGAVKMQKESSTIKSPSARRARKEENSVKVERMDSTPTPLRRSSRLLNR